MSTRPTPTEPSKRRARRWALTEFDRLLFMDLLAITALVIALVWIKKGY